MTKHRILWVDDEIDLLKPHLLFLESKGYEVTPVNNGRDALDKIDDSSFDLVFLDEHMPGMSGLDVLTQLKNIKPYLPVVMVTKNEEERIMEEAIGAKIADYLIKPVKPNQILLSLKKLLDNQRIRTEKTNVSYQQQFAQLSMKIQDQPDWQEWATIYKELVYWELEIDQTSEKSMGEVLQMQQVDANKQFCDFISETYESWYASDEDAPLLSHRVFEKAVAPHFDKDVPAFFIVIDNLRYDQWMLIEPEILKYFQVDQKQDYCSILPTTTQYARNAIFAGLSPLQIKKQLPQYWVDDETDEGKNNYESELLGEQLNRLGYTGKYSYHKIIHEKQGKSLLEQSNKLFQNGLNAVVFNFVDMLSHARTDMNMIKQLAPDESAYRELTRTWFNHSSLFEFLKILAERPCKVVITTDHGTTRVQKPEKIIAEKDTNTNLRYKQGKRLAFDRSMAFEIEDPESVGLPKQHLSSTFAFAKDQMFFAYPNNYNHYANLYKNTFQHGGVSMEEMILPLVTLSPK